jgi:uncharacterized caspase-like protein
MDEARNRINIVVLDACRDNPLPKGRSVARGLVSMQAPRGTFIGFAAAPGQAAMEGEPGGNGVFTGTLVQQLTVPGLAIEEVFKRTIAGVEERTGGKQVPSHRRPRLPLKLFSGNRSRVALTPPTSSISSSAIPIANLPHLPSAGLMH